MKVIITLRDGRDYELDIEKWSELDTWGYEMRKVESVKPIL